MSRGPHELRWVRWVAASAFAAGIAVGLAIPVAVQAMSPRPAPFGPDEVYVGQLAELYGLSSSQVRTLRMILATEIAETTEILRRQPENLPPEVRKVRRRTDERIRAMLSEEQRAAYERDKDTR